MREFASISIIRIHSRLTIIRLCIVSLFFISTLGNCLFGQNVIIRDINSEYDLPKNRVNCVTQDSKGFLWFGMVNGLYKFDLLSFTKFELGDNNIDGFPEVEVRAIAEYQPGKLLIGTNRGLFTFNMLNQEYDSVVFKSQEDVSNLVVQEIHPQKGEGIWLATNRGLIAIREINALAHEFEVLYKFDRGNTKLFSDWLLDIEELNDTIWFQTLAELGYFDKTSESIHSYPSWGANTSIMAYNDQRLLVSYFGNGIRVFNTRKKDMERVKLNENLRDSRARFVFRDHSGKLWVSVSNMGMFVMDSITQQENITLITNKDAKYRNLNSNIIYQIYESTDGAVWICGDEGINMIDIKPEIFNSKILHSGNNSDLTLSVRAISAATALNSLWVGTIGDGLFHYTVQPERIVNIPIENKGYPIGENIQAIVTDSKNRLWLGTEGDGVIRLTFRDNNHFPDEIVNYRTFPGPFPSNSIVNNFIMCLLEDRHSNIWVGSWFGLSLIDSVEAAKADQSFAQIRNFLHDPNNPNSISNNTIMSILETNDGKIYVGTQAGINQIIKRDDSYIFKHQYESKQGEPLTNKRILDMFQDRAGNIWFSTQDGGICLLDTTSGVYTEFNADNGFHDRIVNSISQDSQGILWLGTNNGLCRFNPENLTFHMFFIQDGLLSNDFFYRSKCDLNQMLFLGCNQGLTWFNPDEIVTEPLKPNLVFTDFKIFNSPYIIKSDDDQKHISYAEDIHLKHNQNFITFEFSALNYRHHNTLHYSCMLEGLENSWNNLNREQKITYTNLRPGKYLFKVRANTAGQHNKSSEISIPLTIRPPFWQTIIAYIVYVLVFFVLVLVGYRYILKREKQKHALALERMNAKRLHEMDMLRLQFYTNISHELRTPLTLISAPIETLMSEKSDSAKTQSYYQLIHKNVQRLQRLIDQLLDMRKIEEGHLKMEWSQGDVTGFVRKIVSNFESYAQKRNIAFTFQASQPELVTYFDADKLDKVLFNLISNAFKFTPDHGTISVTIGKTYKRKSQAENFPVTYYTITVTDTGVGMSAEAITEIFKPFHQVNKHKPIGSTGSGIGLSLAKELVDLHKGEIKVESQEGRGSSFMVNLPVIKELEGVEIPEKISNTDTIGTTNQLSEEEEDSKIHKTKTLVLLVEDNDDLRKFTAGELQKKFRLLEASNGEEGYKTATEQIPDVIISDIMMDKMDGLALCKKLKSDQRTSHIPIILLTARQSEEYEQTGFDAGADDYITKPFNIAVLESRIRNLYEQRKNLRKIFGMGTQANISELTSNKVDAMFLQKLNETIEENMENSDFNPVQLAAEMAMSKMQLYRKVAALTNQTVYHYIRNIRMNKAAQLLLHTEMQITEVAYRVGFSEASNFSKAFGKHFNLTPSQFIKENRK